MVLGTLVTPYLPDLATIGLAFLLFKHLDSTKTKCQALTPLYYRENYGKIFFLIQFLVVSLHI